MQLLCNACSKISHSSSGQFYTDMNAQTVFVFVKYPPTAVPVLLDDVVELVTSQQLPGVVFVTADCLHGKRVSLIMITLNDCCMLWALGVGARTGSGGGWERPGLHSVS